MKFYIHKDGQQLGPLSKDELINQNIAKDTMVWFEGAEGWIEAGEIEDLKELFISKPPPIHVNSVVPPLLNKDIEKTNTESRNQRRYTPTVVVIAVLVMIVAAIFIYVNQKANQAEIQKQIEYQNEKIREQERIEAARLAEEEKQKQAAEEAKRQEELAVLKFEYDEAVTNLRAAKIKLEEIQQFKLLRTSDERQQQVQDQLEVIRYWENETDRLQKAIDNY